MGEAEEAEGEAARDGEPLEVTVAEAETTPLEVAGCNFEIMNRIE